MAGTIAGGQAAAKINKEKTTISIDGKVVRIKKGSFYEVTGALGGKKGTTGGFWANRELAREAGKKGGTISKRTKGVK